MGKVRSFRMVDGGAAIDPMKPVLCIRCDRVHQNFPIAMRICGGERCPPNTPEAQLGKTPTIPRGNDES